MYRTLKTLAAVAIAASVLAGAAAAGGPYVKYQPRLSTKVQTPKIVLPKICKNSISRTFVGPNGVTFTAKKCR